MGFYDKAARQFAHEGGWDLIKDDFGGVPLVLTQGNEGVYKAFDAIAGIDAVATVPEVHGSPIIPSRLYSFALRTSYIGQEVTVRVRTEDDKGPSEYPKRIHTLKLVNNTTSYHPMFPAITAQGLYDRKKKAFTSVSYFDTYSAYQFMSNNFSVIDPIAQAREMPMGVLVRRAEDGQWYIQTTADVLRAGGVPVVTKYE